MSRLSRIREWIAPPLPEAESTTPSLDDVRRQVRHIEIRARRALRDALAGEYRTAFRGRGLEFAELQPLQPRRRCPLDRLEGHRPPAHTRRPPLRRGARADGADPRRRLGLHGLRRVGSVGARSRSGDRGRARLGRRLGQRPRRRRPPSPTMSCSRFRRPRARATCSESCATCSRSKPAAAPRWPARCATPVESCASAAS